MRKFAIVISLILLSSSVMGQARVGTSGANELNFTTNVESIGMGETGVASVSAYSYFQNPATLGLFAFENKFSISGYISKPTVIVVDAYSNNVSVPIFIKKFSNSQLAFGVGNSYTKYSTKVQITTYEFPEGTGEFREISLKNNNTTLGLGIRFRNVEFGFGVNFKYFKENYIDIETDGIAFDFGSMVRLYHEFSSEDSKLRTGISGSLGFSYANIGPDVDLGIDALSDPRIVFNSKFSLTKASRVGFGAKFYLADEYLEYFHLTGLYDFQSTDFEQDLNKYGFEIAIFEMGALRFGKAGSDVTSYGFSVSSIGFFKLISGGSEVSKKSGLLSFLSKRFNLVYNYANYEDDAALLNNKRNYHSLKLEYNL